MLYLLIFKFFCVEESWTSGDHLIDSEWAMKAFLVEYFKMNLSQTSQEVQGLRLGASSEGGKGAKIPHPPHPQFLPGLLSTPKKVEGIEMNFSEIHLESATWKSGTVLCFVNQSFPTLCGPMDCSPPGSSVHGASPGKNTGVGCHALLQGIFPTQRWNPGLPHCRLILYHLSHQGSPEQW